MTSDISKHLLPACGYSENAKSVEASLRTSGPLASLSPQGGEGLRVRGGAAQTCLSGRVSRALAFVLLLFGITSSSRADDWFRWRGPDLNGISRETNWFKPWPKEGPAIAWKANVGPGYSTVSVADGRVFTCGSTNKTETVTCLAEKTGNIVWQHTYPTAFKPEFYEGGSSGTPTIDGSRVFHLGQMGELFCFDAATGKIIWSNNIVKVTGTKIPTWGLTGAPLVIG